jgi:hypothetical protein
VSIIIKVSTAQRRVANNSINKICERMVVPQSTIVLHHRGLAASQHPHPHLHLHPPSIFPSATTTQTLAGGEGGARMIAAMVMLMTGTRMSFVIMKREEEKSVAELAGKLMQQCKEERIGGGTMEKIPLPLVSPPKQLLQLRQ